MYECVRVCVCVYVRATEEALALHPPGVLGRQCGDARLEVLGARHKAPRDALLRADVVQLCDASALGYEAETQAARLLPELFNVHLRRNADVEARLRLVGYHIHRE